MNLISKNGYSILKEKLTLVESEELKSELTVKPRVSFNSGIPVESFKIYKENKLRFFIPRNYGIKNFGIPDKDKIKDGDKINLNFNGELRDSQKEPVEKSLKHLSKNPGGIMSLECAAGKCFGHNTKVQMFNGSVKYIQDLIPGELLMGDDGTPRTVLTTCSGYGKLFKIRQDFGDSYVVNEEHILSVKNNNYKKIDVDLKNLNTNIHFGYKEHSNFSIKFEDNINFYDMGYEYLNLNKIPENILFNSFDNRIKFLSGIFDYNLKYKDNYFVELSTYKIFNENFYKLLNNLGLYYQKLDSLIIKVFGNNLNFLNLKFYKKNMVNDNFCKLVVEPISDGRYYGLTTDKNHRFLLEDNTVVHNTVMGLYIGNELGQKMLVVVHTEVLLEQWIERIEMFLPDARIGRIQQNKFDIDDKDIVIGMLQTIVARDYTPEKFMSFGTVIFDECHHLGARVFSQCFNKLVSKKMIGLTATVNRKDGLTKVFKYYIGDIMYSMKKKLNTHNVKIEGIHYFSNSELHKEFYNRRGDLNFPGMLNNIVKIPDRNNLIVNKIKEFIEEGRKIILLSHRINHLKLLKLMIEKENILSVGLYIGGMKMETLEQSKKSDILLGTYNMVSEGFDDPKRDTLILSTPLSDVVQSAGRILRKQHESQPIILDIIDEFSVFPKQWKKRSSYYKKEKWEIKEIEILDNKVINKEYSEPEPITECVL
jgi:superfamily II DNA or RNA helicase